MQALPVDKFGSKQDQRHSSVIDGMIEIRPPFSGQKDLE